MKDTLKIVWVMIAIALIVPTTALDLRTHVDSNNVYGQHLANAGQQLTPAPPLQYELCPGDTVTIQHDIYLPPVPIQADILFAFDTTGSMGEVIQTVQERAVEIMSNLQTLIGDVRFGVTDFRDYPFAPYGDPEDWPYLLRQPLTRQIADVQMKIEELESQGGGNLPEAYTRALYETYADEQIGWRSEVRRFVIMFGDSVAHDNDLNAGVPPPQPHLPNEEWQTAYPPPHLDPGRDAQNGTEDDLDFQPTLGALRDRSITLLFIVSDVSRSLDLSTEELLVYWRTWAAMTGPGGGAEALENVDALPATIQALVTAAVRHIERLTVNVAPSWFDEWVTITPPAYEDLDIPPGGLQRDFEVQITVPPNTLAGRYVMVLIAEADGTVYQRQPVEITVNDRCFATPTPTFEPLPTLKPRWLLYMPFIANNHVNLQRPWRIAG